MARPNQSSLTFPSIGVLQDLMLTHIVPVTTLRMETWLGVSINTPSLLALNFVSP